MNRGIMIAAGIIGFIIISMAVKNNIVPKLGVENGKLKGLPSTPNAVSTQTDDMERRIEPLDFAESLEETREALMKSVESYGNYRLVSQDENYIHVEFKTETMGYKDDVEFYLDRREKIVHVRSSSRIGYSDGGLNKRRYQAIRESYSSYIEAD